MNAVSFNNLNTTPRFAQLFDRARTQVANAASKNLDGFMSPPRATCPICEADGQEVNAFFAPNTTDKRLSVLA